MAALVDRPFLLLAASFVALLVAAMLGVVAERLWSPVKASDHNELAIVGTVRNLVCGAILTPMEGAYGNQERHPGRFAGGA
jgi:hypothetical protein